MVTIKNGNLFTSKAKYICHQVNCKGKMGSGVALQVKQRYPEVYKRYKQMCDAVEPQILLGSSQVCPIKDGKQFIVNMFAQNNYGYDGKKYTDSSAFLECLKSIKTFATTKDIIAMPYKIGCCRGGASWKEIYSFIEEILKDYNVELWKMEE